jgi:Protein of unknown function (DUF1573)
MKIRNVIPALLVSMLLLGSFSIIKAQDAAKPASGIEWTSTTIDFGKIEQGKPVSAEFDFKNPTMVPLLISSVRPTCGCTIADYPKEPILPGKSGKIAVTYNAAAGGVFTKSIVVTSNATEGNTSLIIKGEVVPKNQ